MNRIKRRVAVSRRELAACAAFVAASVPGFSQTVPPVKPAESGGSEVVELSPFVVKQETKDGYQAQQTVVGSRTAKNILDIPANISIINAEQIKDLNAVEVSQVLAVGVSGVTRNQTINDDVNIRGFRTASSLRNGVTKSSFKRNPMFDVERIEVLKGPGALILGNNSFLGGAVNFVSMRATATPMAQIQTTFSTDNYVRLSGNVSGPLVKTDDFKLNYRVTVGALTGDRPKEIEDKDDQKFIGGGLAMYFGSNISVLVNAYYFVDDGYFYWNDFLDVSGPVPTLKSLALAKIHPNSTESYSVGRSRNAFWTNSDSFIDVTMLAKLTENGNLRAYYFGGNLVDRRRHVRGITMGADNFTLARQDIPVVIDNVTHNAQIDYMHRLPLEFLSLDTTIGLDGSVTESRTGTVGERLAGPGYSQSGVSERRRVFQPRPSRARVWRIFRIRARRRRRSPTTFRRTSLSSRKGSFSWAVCAGSRPAVRTPISSRTSPPTGPTSRSKRTSTVWWSRSCRMCRSTTPTRRISFRRPVSRIGLPPTTDWALRSQTSRAS
jgi:outer membrane receptor protein involved in Fe transport